MTNHARRPRRRRATLIVGAVLSLTAVIAPATVRAADTVTLTAAMTGVEDVAGSGTFTLTLEPAINRACFVADVELTDPVGHPPHTVGVNDFRLGSNATMIEWKASFTSGGVDSGCKTISAALMDDILDHATSYTGVVYSDNYGSDRAAIGGFFAYPYPTTTVDITTKACPFGIDDAGELAGHEDECETVVRPDDDPTGDHPGYTDIGLGRPRSFNYLVEDSQTLDATISDAALHGTTGTCDAGTLVCDHSGLHYRYENVATGQVDVSVYAMPTGFTFGSATANVPIVVGDGTMTVDASGGPAAVTVYLLRLPDTTRPTTSGTLIRFATGVAAGSGAMARVTWTGSDPGGTGVDHYIVERRLGTGSWTLLSDDVPTNSYVTPIPKGQDVRFRVRAVDEAGNTSSPSSYSSVDELIFVENTSSRVTYGGTWGKASMSSASGGSVHYASTAGKTARLSFSGRAVVWIAPRSSTRGKASVYIDGKYAATIDLKATATSRVQVFTKTWTSVGSHSIMIRVSGTSGRPRVDLDAFAYLR